MMIDYPEFHELCKAWNIEKTIPVCLGDWLDEREMPKLAMRARKLNPTIYPVHIYERIWSFRNWYNNEPWIDLITQKTMGDMVFNNQYWKMSPKIFTYHSPCIERGILSEQPLVIHYVSCESLALLCQSLLVCL